ncbi:similar to Saccharomyces cerevisiae YLR100W ERG27 3-keto sterol reductase [Maudiozyma saulgeensis]|uniref:3beta-hydroxysteroid 3-dehydrogenase n=1 Tax=Maudiozyma saulgeensis TaxID=1789683 RepID=A0A1X7R5Y4_9SACH|nr:similar to Saccharomyces cerevisiae YLR100W ERG27 3-keto sterol reductase [Kazachstania saulgeensis]
MPSEKVVLIIGANSTLGLNIAYRQIESQDPEDSLTFILTSRSIERAKEAGDAIKTFNDQREATREVKTVPLVLDLTDMKNVLNASITLNKTYKEINYVYVNAALGVCSGINWFRAIQEVITNPVQAVTDPHYKIQKVGLMSKDDMGLVFEANIFGPYYLIRKILQVLSAGKAVIVWISSIRSDPSYLPFNDLELIESSTPYEGSKRMIDVMHLATYKSLKAKGIYQYVVQPGIFVSQSFNVHLNIITYYLMMIMFYLARRWGSYWHTIDPYKAANSPVYVTTFRDRDFERQDIKYGSATYNDGVEHIKPEELNSIGKGQVLEFLSSKEKEWDIRLNVQETKN